MADHKGTFEVGRSTDDSSTIVLDGDTATLQVGCGPKRPLTGQTGNIEMVYRDGQKLFRVGTTLDVSGGGKVGGQLELFDDKEKRTVIANGMTGGLRLGGNSKAGDIVLEDADGEPTVRMDGKSARAQFGGHGANGQIVLFAGDANPASDSNASVHLSGLVGLRWEAFYENRVCVQLEQARYRMLVATLPDMMDPNLPVEQRLALFDTLNRRDDEFRAMQTFIGVLGTVEQRTAVDRFMDARQLFMDNFTPAPPTPGTIQAVAAFFDSVASEIVGLRADVAAFGQGLIDALTLEHLLGSDSDDKSREAVGALGARRAVLPSRWKAALIHMMEEGNCDDDDEQAILLLLTDSKTRSISDFAQLVHAQGWESLSFSFDGQEYDDLELLLSKW